MRQEDGELRVVGIGDTLREGSTLNHVAHALRAVAAPLSVPMGRPWEAFDKDGNPRDAGVAERLERLVVEMAAKLNPDAGAVDRALLGVA